MKVNLKILLKKWLKAVLENIFEEICVLDQAFVKNPDQKVGQFVQSKVQLFVNLCAYEVGEGIEKREENFAEEVMSQIKK